jgi:hypothetical protein
VPDGGGEAVPDGPRRRGPAGRQPDEPRREERFHQEGIALRCISFFLFLFKIFIVFKFFSLFILLLFIHR